jgi:nitrite reductase/ring-hydroxylating ferredoxin subunit
VEDQALAGKPLVGHVGDQEILLVRRGAEVFAVGASCTGYHGPLAEGLVVEHTVRCPWHHASFDLLTGLRRARYQRSIVMLSNDAAPPVDRPNLSKSFLAGSAPEDRVPLRPDGYYKENDIDLRLNADVAAIDVRAREVMLKDGSKVSYDRLLLATDAEPVRLTVPGGDRPHVLPFAHSPTATGS